MPCCDRFRAATLFTNDAPSLTASTHSSPICELDKPSRFFPNDFMNCHLWQLDWITSLLPIPALG
jgi:hypothetical protein